MRPHHSAERERVKRQTIAERQLHHRLQAAWPLCDVDQILDCACPIVAPAQRLPDPGRKSTRGWSLRAQAWDRRITVRRESILRHWAGEITGDPGASMHVGTQAPKFATNHIGKVPPVQTSAPPTDLRIAEIEHNCQNQRSGKGGSVSLRRVAGLGPWAFT